MSKSDTANAKNLTNQNYQSVGAQGAGQNQQLQDTLKGLQPQTAADYGAAGAGYSNFADTGGISGPEEQAMKSAATAGVGGVYQTLEDQAARQSTSAGANPAAAIAQISRNAGEAESQAITQTEANVADLRQAGREFGVGGQASLYGMDVQQMETVAQQILQNFQTTGQLQQGDLAILQRIAQQPGVGSNIIGAIGTIGGAVAGAGTKAFTL